MKKTTNINPWTPAAKAAGQKPTVKKINWKPSHKVNSVNEE